MKRIVIYTAIGLATCLIGIVLAIYFQLKENPVAQINCDWTNSVRGKSGYDILNTKSAFGEDVDFYHEFTSPETTQYLFKANSEGQLKEKNVKLNGLGVRIGERGVNVNPTGATRIYWTDGDEFWLLDAASLSLARKVERQCFSH